MDEREGAETSGHEVTDPGGRWVSTVRASSELVRSNAVPLLRGWASRLQDELDGDAFAGATLAMRQMDRIVVTCEGARMGTLELEDFLEVVEYDPVRHVALVIGLRDAPRSLPLVWLMLRMHPGAEGVVVLPALDALEPRRVRPAPRGSFDQAFAVGELMAGKGREALLGPTVGTFEGVGTVLVVPPRGDPVSVLALVDG